MGFFNSFLNLDFQSMLGMHRGAAILFLVLSVVVGLIACLKGRSFLKTWALSMITTPLMALPVAVCLKSGKEARRFHKPLSSTWQFLGYLFALFILFMPLCTAAIAQFSVPEMQDMQTMGWLLPILTWAVLYFSVDGIKARQLFSLGAVAIIFGYLILSFSHMPSLWSVFAIGLFYTGVPVCQVAIYKSITREQFECRGTANLFATLLAFAMILSWVVLPLNILTLQSLQSTGDSLFGALTFAIVLLGLVVGLTLTEKAKSECASKGQSPACQGCGWSVGFTVLCLPIIAMLVGHWAPSKDLVLKSSNVIFFVICLIALILCAGAFMKHLLAQVKSPSVLSRFTRVFHVILLVLMLYILSTSSATAFYLTSLAGNAMDFLSLSVMSGLISAVVVLIIFKHYGVRLTQWNAYLSLIAVSFLVGLVGMKLESGFVFMGILSVLAFLLVLTYTGWLHTIGKHVGLNHRGRAVVLMLIIFKLVQQVSAYIMQMPIHSSLQAGMTQEAHIKGMLMHMMSVAHVSLVLMTIAVIVAFVVLIMKACCGQSCDSVCQTETSCHTEKSCSSEKSCETTKSCESEKSCEVEKPCCDAEKSCDAGSSENKAGSKAKKKQS